MRKSIALLLFVWLAVLPSILSADQVKQSASGICHSAESPYYSRTRNYTGFDSIDDCLESGGRLPKGVALNESASVTLATNGSGYDRSKFGHGWDDSDGGCQDSRAEALIDQSSTKVRFADERRCSVVTGRWISPFTGKVIQNASDIDIDHVVPLKWAWEHGANTWSRAKREKFANDPVNLWSVELSLNRQKGAKGPEDWLPPAGRCQYVSRFFRIMKIYDLKPSGPQVDIYRGQLAEYCS